jgi:orotidine-5'-phosphate decarboxylase
MSKAPIALALDAPDLDTMRTWALAASPFISTIKIGLETFYRDGARACDIVEETDCDFFLDLKLHDIPNTVKGAAQALRRFGPRYLTVHAAGGPAMIEAATQELPDTLITAVTILTSLNDSELQRMGIETPGVETVVKLATVAVASGARAIVCSPHEVASVRAVVPAEIVLITPGVRPASSKADDQKRVSTPKQALSDGADLLVIGRPITAAPDIATAAREIAEGIG